jgi:two-component system, OmpR family, phosphate regulon sensor histidine kinase PhoR
MNTSLRKTGLLLLAVVVLPVLVFSVFEIGSMRRNEKVIQDIYKNQLDAILFSVNQYSDDIVSNLASRIENSLNNHQSDSIPEINRLITEFPAAVALLQLKNDLGFLSSLPYSFRDSSLLTETVSMLGKNEKTTKQLQVYLNGGYRKIESVGKVSRNLQLIVFCTYVRDQYLINGLVIDPGKFITLVLDPKIQEIAKDKFYIAAYRPGEETPFYTTDKHYNPERIDDRKPFWLLNDYLMGIELRNVTIADLARERTKRNFILVILMDTILLSGTWIIFRNVRKQIELSQMKSDFVANVSHEIRTPLSLISMYIETLDMGRIKSAEKVKEYYGVILNETSRLSGIVNRILSFSQIENNKKKYVFAETLINEVVENAAITFRYSLENKGFSYSFIPCENLPGIMADREAIADAFINLIDNAMKYSADTKDIIVRTGINENYVFVEVEDHGIGISEKDQKYIFDKFFRVTEKNLANKVKGSGLGLAIVKHIMDIHKGRIFVKSVPGSGSLFRLQFPVKK